MTGEAELPGRTVVIRDGRIAAVTLDSSPIPGDVRSVDAGELFLLPGLADMHVHLRRDHVAAYLRHGITTVRDMWGWSEVSELVEEVGQGGRVPTILPASPGVDGDPPVRTGGIVLTAAEEAERLPAELLDQGWHYLKVYQRLGADLFGTLSAAAEAVDLPLVGHVPNSVTLELALSTFRSIEHLEGYDKALTGRRRLAFGSWAEANDTAEMREWARRTAEAGVWNDPTLFVATRSAANNLTSGEADRVVENRRRMVLALWEEGAPLLVGSDGGLPVTPPGASLHGEIAELVAAGIPLDEVLRLATAGAAAFAGSPGEFGSIRPGGRADLLLVRGDPRVHLSVLDAPVAVLLRGEWLDPDRL